MDAREYLAEEVALDHADGLLSRREALRRLGLLGLGTGAAAALLGEAAASVARAAGSRPAPGGPGAALSSLAAIHDVTFRGPEGRRLLGTFAAARGRPKGSVLVVHENRGLTDHIRSVAGRLAGSGYSALAVDLVSEEGGTRAIGDEARIMAILAATPPQRFVADMRAGLTELGRRVPGRRSAAVGFCFGGGQVWNLVNSGDRRLVAAVPFYGLSPQTPDFARSRAAVLAIYGGLDARVNATRARAIDALRRARLPHRVHTFPGADHAFFNSTGPRYNPAAAREAYRELLRWFERHVAAA